jgi:DNA/RNA-binding domain of Phe-tRNA-synthetase-like protein
VIRLDPQLASRVRLGVIRANSVVVRADAAAVWAEIERVAGEYRRRYADKPPSDIPDLQPARDLYRRTGEDPTKLRPSSEALLRRVLRGDSLSRVNSLVDTCNLCSLEFLLPIGLYDLDRISDEVTARIGQDGEGYESLGKGFYSVEGRLALFDESGPFGSPTNDSRRTAITDATQRCLMVIFAPATHSLDLLSAHVRHASSRLQELVDAGGVDTAIVPS